MQLCVCHRGWAYACERACVVVARRRVGVELALALDSRPQPVASRPAWPVVRGGAGGTRARPGRNWRRWSGGGWRDAGRPAGAAPPGTAPQWPLGVTRRLAPAAAGRRRQHAEMAGSCPRAPARAERLPVSDSQITTSAPRQCPCPRGPPAPPRPPRPPPPQRPPVPFLRCAHAGCPPRRPTRRPRPPPSHQPPASPSPPSGAPCPLCPQPRRRRRLAPRAGASPTSSRLPSAKTASPGPLSTSRPAHHRASKTYTTAFSAWDSSAPSSSTSPSARAVTT